MKKKFFLTHIFSSPIVAKMFAWAIRGLISLLYCTLRVKIEGKKEFLESLKSRKEKPVLIALWHNKLMLLAPLMRSFAPKISFSMLISKSRDGALPSTYAETYKGVSVIRVAHDARHEALYGAVSRLAEGSVVMFTPDGPRGPRYSVKPGIFFAQEKSDAIIYAFNWTASRAWHLGTWDHFCIPKPFATITLILKPVPVTGTLAQKETLLKEALTTSEP